MEAVTPTTFLAIKSDYMAVGCTTFHTIYVGESSTSTKAKELENFARGATILKTGDVIQFLVAVKEKFPSERRGCEGDQDKEEEDDQQDLSKLLQVPKDVKRFILDEALEVDGDDGGEEEDTSHASDNEHEGEEVVVATPPRPKAKGHSIAITGSTSGVVTRSGAGGGAVTGQKRKKGPDDEGAGLRARRSRK
ncbi:hypothetical protein M427DRAFT_39738 [Gonapodya prolifera JEL478]|uniref:Uncharacterized protein n=1 Tax=Gonapodya prolifera (strain JEL478) TaxID=1344416 RepID=A0A138ZWW0_GONPJ|nr:hypothetical protein M427DRAFT_39738 [Gonapodya prolifera JEL478]|eukprot:KXS08999.1 hypothetical protein M427DRAFT_39738 [Gonapodya prolifera JEL478]